MKFHKGDLIRFKNTTQGGTAIPHDYSIHSSEINEYVEGKYKGQLEFKQNRGIVIIQTLNYVIVKYIDINGVEVRLGFRNPDDLELFCVYNKSKIDKINSILENINNLSK